MSIKVNTYQLQSKSAYAASIASQLGYKVDQINNIYYDLDSKVRNRRGIGSSLRSLHNRIDNAQRKMYNISNFLNKAADKYNTAEAAVVARGASLVSAASVGAAAVGAMRVGTSTGSAQGKVEGKKWYNSNWFKIAVGAAVIGVAVAVAVLASPAIAAIAAGAAVGAGIGAIVGGVIGGVSSARSGGKFIDGFANGFMAGSITGALSGAAGAATSAAGLGFAASAAADGAVDSAIYVGETLLNGGKVTAVGIATSFAMGMGFSALGSVAVNKVGKAMEQKAIRDNVTKNLAESKAAREASKFSEYAKKEKELIEALNSKKAAEGARKTGVGKTGQGIPLDEVKPEVLKQIHPDDNAAYGYSPNKDTPYAEYDFTDIDKASQNRAIREEYLEQSKKIQEEIDKMLQQGASKDEIAEKVVNMRNQDKIEARTKMSPEELAPIEARNIKLYGDPIGPTKEYLFSKYKKELIKEQLYESDEQVWDIIIQKSMKKDDVINTLLGIEH